jgi:hypothetical protein
MSSTAHYVGAPITPQRLRKVRDPQRGLQIVEFYKGTPAEINAVIALVASNQRWETEESGDGMIELNIYTPDATDPADPASQEDTWELLNNRVEKDLYEHPKSKAISDENIALIREWKRKPPLDGLPPTFTGTAPEIAEAETLLYLLHRGTTKFTTGEYVLRYSVTCSRNSSVTASFADVEKLFTPTQLGTPATSGVTIPGTLRFSIGAIEAKTAPTGFLWSWLKIAPTVRATPRGGVVVISQEWWLDLWSTWVYVPKT